MRLNAYVYIMKTASLLLRHLASVNVITLYSIVLDGCIINAGKYKSENIVLQPQSMNKYLRENVNVYVHEHACIHSFTLDDY